MKKLIFEILKFVGGFIAASFVLGLGIACSADVPMWISMTVVVLSIILCVILAVNLVRVWPRKDDSDKVPEVPKPGRWNFIYDESRPDTGINQFGIISDGMNFLFYHAYKIETEDPVETCFIYSSMYMEDSFEECRYPWTAENDEILLDALNKADRDPHVTGSFCGERSVLRTLEFKPYNGEE